MRPAGPSGGGPLRTKPGCFQHAAGPFPRARSRSAYEALEVLAEGEAAKALVRARRFQKLGAPGEPADRRAVRHARGLRSNRWSGLRHRPGGMKNPTRVSPRQRRRLHQLDQGGPGLDPGLPPVTRTPLRRRMGRTAAATDAARAAIEESSSAHPADRQLGRQRDLDRIGQREAAEVAPGGLDPDLCPCRPPPEGCRRPGSATVPWPGARG